MIKDFLLFHFVFLLLLWMWYSYHHLYIVPTLGTQQHSQNNRLSVSTPTSLTHNPIKIVPIRREGVIFFTDASTGAVRDAALSLTQQGFHVVVGASSKAEQRSFAYLARKGLEIIPFNLYDPSTYPDAVYRLRHIRRDLDRPLVSLVINLADYVIKEAFVQKHDSMLDVDYASNQYRNIIKSPMRFTQALVELSRLQTKEGRNPVLERKLELAAAANAGNSESMKKTKENVTTASNSKGDSDSIWDLGALRISLLVAAASANSTVEEREQIELRCGIVCLYQQTTIDYFDQLSRAEFLRNHSVSIIPAKELSLSSSVATENNKKENSDNLDTIFAKDIDWAIGASDSSATISAANTAIVEESETHDEKISTAGKAIIHSLLSKSPHHFYDLGDMSLNLNFKSKKAQRVRAAYGKRSI